MVNHYVCVGRLVADPELKETETGKSYSNVTVAVPRSYKNSEGEYETDFLDCTLWDTVAKKTAEYCKKGDMISIKGRVETRTYETDAGEKRKVTNIVADNVSFLQSNPKEKTNDQELD